VSGKTELGLAFDKIVYPDGTRRPIDAQLEKVIRTEAVKKVDEEGNIESESRTTESEKRGVIGAAAGAIIGGIAGGGKGALIGILLGGAAGVGTVYVEGNNDLILDTGAELVIRTAGRSGTR
jgi:outer membrane lipoprotein SlyB